MFHRREAHAAWQARALTLGLLALSLPLAARGLYGPPGAWVHVRWQPSVDAAERQRLETRLLLADGREVEPSTWRYDLTAPSKSNIRAIVEHPAVTDTHHIDRQRYTIEPSTTWTARRHGLITIGGDVAVDIADRLAMILAALAGLFVLLRHPLQVSRTAVAAVARWLQRGIPEIDADTLGTFRIVFGIAALAFAACHPVNASWLHEPNLKVFGELHASTLQWLRGRPQVVNLLTPWLMVTGMIFIAGVFTRWSFALFVAGMLVWAHVYMAVDGMHPIGTLTLTLLALLPSRWGDARSADAWLRGHRGAQSAAHAPGKHYGYSVWVPGLVLGIAFAAAAASKLQEGSDWIVNGTVKYHFITDSIKAPVDWGLQLAHYPRVAILMSLFAVVTEAVVVTAAFMPSWRYRLGMGVATLVLLTGFGLFQGLFWTGWWILLLGFLPWQRLSRRTPAQPVPARLTTAPQLAVVVAVVAQQVVASAFVLEHVPALSAYDMYSKTYASAEEFNASREPVYRIVSVTDRGPVELPCEASEIFVDEFRSALTPHETGARARVWQALRTCGQDLTKIRSVTLEGDRNTFDWNRLHFNWIRAAVVLGPLPADKETTGTGGITASRR